MRRHAVICQFCSPHRPILRTQINKIVRLVALLKKSGLIDSVRLGSRCYIHITEAAHKLYAKPTTPPDSHIHKHSVSSVNDGVDMEKYDGPIMQSRDDKSPLSKIEQYKEEQSHTQNSYSDDEFERVKRELEMIFPKRNWSNAEIALLRIQMPIPTWELTLIQRFYRLVAPTNYSLKVIKMTEAEFLLTRRRHTLRTLLENWSDEVSRARCFFETGYGMEEAADHGWNFSEMQPPPNDVVSKNP